MGRVILEAVDLVQDYRRHGGDLVHAVQGVSLGVERGATLGIVGESGCGKSTTARLLALLESPTSGVVRIGERDVTSAGRKGLRALRKQVQMVFQDPYSSLNPRIRIGNAITEVLRVHDLTSGRAEEQRRAAELLEMVGLAATHLGRRPHELSGGQRQRVAIARALAVEPEILVLDEPVSALDVSVRAEIINLLTRLRSELGLTMIFISHDLGMVRYISDDIATMYLGKVVELGAWRNVVHQPLHPYTKALHAAIPVPDPVREAQRQITPLEGEPPDPARPPLGCNFNTRCPLAEDICFELEPDLAELRPGHRAACHVVARELLAPASGS